MEIIWFVILYNIYYNIYYIGLEYMFSAEDNPPTKVSHGLDKYDPPEKSSRKRSCKWSSDMWGLGKSSIV